MESCSTCHYTNVCDTCAAGYVSYRDELYAGSGTICLQNCPTGTEQVGNQCIFHECLNIFFPLFWTSELDGVYDGLEIQGKTVDNLGDGPIPVYGRGFYIDNLSVSQEDR
jgi:hypothetical protein